MGAYTSSTDVFVWLIVELMHDNTPVMFSIAIKTKTIAYTNSSFIVFETLRFLSDNLLSFSVVP